MDIHIGLPEKMTLNYRPPVPLGFLNRADLIALLAVAVITLGHLGIWSFVAEYKPLDGDAVCFVPVARNIASGRGWVNEFYHPKAVADPGHPERYVWHGFLAPRLWALAAPSEDFKGVRQGGIILSALGLAFSGLVLLRAMHGTTLRPGLRMLTITLCLGGVAPFIAHDGRPEAVAVVLSAAFLALLPRKVGPMSDVILGVGLGLMAATSPASALILFFPLVVYLLISSQNPILLARRLVTTGVVAALAIMLVVLTSGSSLGEWLRGMQLHSKDVVWSRSQGGWSEYWLTAAGKPLLLGFVCCLGIATVLLIRREGGLPKWKWIICGGSALGFCLLVYLLALKIAPNHYNLSVMLAMGWIICFAHLVRSKTDRLRTKAAFVMLVGASLLMILGTMRIATISYQASKDGLSRSQARILLARDLNEIAGSERVLLTPGLFELADTSALKMKSVEVRPIFLLQTTHNDEIVVHQQANTGSNQVPQINGLNLMADRFSSSTPHFGSIRLGNTTGSYSYAIYR